MDEPSQVGLRGVGMKGMTPFEALSLRIKCTEVFIDSCSKNDLTKEQVFKYGQQLWDESVKILDDVKPELPPANKKR